MVMPLQPSSSSSSSILPWKPSVIDFFFFFLLLFPVTCARNHAIHDMLVLPYMYFTRHGHLSRERCPVPSSTQAPLHLGAVMKTAHSWRAMYS